MDPWRIVLLGKTGMGKSATGNTLLGEKAFLSEARATSVTTTCTPLTRVINGRRITVIDTPGLYDTCMSKQYIVNETIRGVKLAAPGPHVFLLVTDLRRFTEEEKNTVRNFQQIFGSGVHQHMIVLFTRGDDLEHDNKTIETFIEEAGPDLRHLIVSCSWRYHVFNNRKITDRSQVENLFKKINMMLSINNHSYYSYELFTMAMVINDVRASDRARDKKIAELEAKLRNLQTVNPKCSIL